MRTVPAFAVAAILLAGCSSPDPAAPAVSGAVQEPVKPLTEKVSIKAVAEKDDDAVIPFCEKVFGPANGIASMLGLTGDYKYSFGSGANAAKGIGTGDHAQFSCHIGPVAGKDAGTTFGVIASNDKLEMDQYEQEVNGIYTGVETYHKNPLLVTDETRAKMAAWLKVAAGNIGP